MPSGIRNELLLFAPHSSPNPTSVYTEVEFTSILAAADLSGDSKDEIVVWGVGSKAQLAIFEAGNVGELAQAAAFESLPSPGGLPRRAIVGDIDNDGTNEVVLLAESTVLDNYGILYVLHSLPYRIERVGPTLNLQSNSALTTDDVDGDRIQDLIVTERLGEKDGFLVLKGVKGDSTNFKTSCAFTLSSRPTGIVVTDFDNDGEVDAAILLPDEKRIEVIWGFMRECVAYGGCYQKLDVIGSKTAQSCFVADLTNDGRDEIIEEEPEAFQVFEPIQGSLQHISNIPKNFDSKASKAFDLDSDGVKDFVTMDATGLRCVVYFLNSYAEAVQEKVVSIGVEAGGFALLDVNGDGLGDIVVTVPEKNELQVFLQKSSREFIKDKEFPAGLQPREITRGEFDDDKISDVAVINNEGTVSILRGLNGGSFEIAFSTATIRDSKVIAAGRLNDDAVDDIVVASEERDGLAILLSKGRDFETRYFALSPGTGPSSLAIADLDKDGFGELIVGNSGAGSTAIYKLSELSVLQETEVIYLDDSLGLPKVDVSVFAAQLDKNGLMDLVVKQRGVTLYTAQGCGREALFRRGDVNGDSSVNLSDAVDLLLALFAGKGGLTCEDAADANDDSRVNLTDAVRILEYLFEGQDPPALPGPSECGADPTLDGLQVCDRACFE